MRDSGQTRQFDVFVHGNIPGSADDWDRALRAPSSEINGLLSESDKEFARKLHIEEQDYARSRLLRKYAEERLNQRGFELGQAVSGILDGLGPDYGLNAVIFEDGKPRWVVRIGAPRGVVNIAIPVQLADDVVNSDTVQDQEQLRKLLLSNLGRSELIRN